MVYYYKIFLLIILFQFFFNFTYSAVDSLSNHNEHEKAHQSINKEETAKEAYGKHETENLSKQYSKLLHIKRREQLNSVQSLSNQKDYKKQKDTVKQLINAIRKVLVEDKNILSNVEINNIEEVLSDKSVIRDNFARVVENIAFYGDITLRFPLQSGIKYNKDIEFKSAVNWAYDFSNNFSYLYDNGTLKMLNLFAQELTIIPREADYHNPYDIKNIKEDLIREASLKMKKEIEEKKRAKKEASLKIKKDKSQHNEFTMVILGKKQLMDCYDDGDLDLSSLKLTQPPLYKDLVALPAFTTIDLSSNLISCLSNDFCLLVKLTKIDLSKNQLTVLPDNFGALVNLRKLDLYDNKLKDLPLSFGRLHNLKWLDISGNPINEDLLMVAGKDQGNKQYETSALNIVAYMQKRKEKKDKENKEARNANKKKNKEALKEVNNLINENLEGKERYRVEKQQPKKKESTKNGKNNEPKDDLPKGKKELNNQKTTTKDKSKTCGFFCNLISSAVRLTVILGLIYSLLLGYNCHQYSMSPRNVFLPRSELFCKDALKSLETRTLAPTLGSNLNRAVIGSYDKFVLPKVNFVSKKLDEMGVKDHLVSATNFVHTKTVSGALFAQKVVSQGTVSIQKWYNKEGFKYFEAFKKAALETLRFVVDTIFSIAEWLVEFFTPIFEKIADLVVLLINDREKFFNRVSQYWNEAKESVASRT
uniref:Lupus La protein n=1 Tax=Strongyloides stercoralis TaxID=6248 RepID=A0AAF5DBL6_STRER